MTTALQGAEFDVLSDDSELVLSHLHHPTDGPTVEVVLSQAHLVDRAAIQPLIDRITREVEDWNREHRLRMPAGVVKHLHVVAHAVPDDATAGTESTYAEIQALKDRLQSENIVLREEIDKTSMFEEIVGTSPPLRAVLSHVSKVAPTDSTVLITGETGTGKELIAQAIHKRSPCSARAFGHALDRSAVARRSIPWHRACRQPLHQHAGVPPKGRHRGGPPGQQGPRGRALRRRRAARGAGVDAGVEDQGAAHRQAALQVGVVVGFRTVSHFTAVFHRVTGTAPRAYRAAYRPVSTGGHDDVL